MALNSAESIAQYQYDTLKIENVAEGIRYFEIHEPKEPWNIYAVEVDLKNPSINLSTVIATNKLSGYETMSAMVKRTTTANKNIVAAINGDFYDGHGRPTNTQIIDGEIVKKPNKRPVLLFNKNNEIDINRVRYNGRVISHSDSIYINGINRMRGENELIFYNKYHGESTGTNKYGTEVILKQVSSPAVNTNLKAVVIAKSAREGNTAIDSDNYVLSAHGTASEKLSSIGIGDTLHLKHELSGTGLTDLTGAIGGSNIIIENGASLNEWPERHPRTAVGYNKDKTKLYLVAVDGRQAQSVGMTLAELGNYMLTTPIFNAINLDGGASTTMIINGKVANKPSLIRERTVSNGLYIYISNSD